MFEYTNEVLADHVNKIINGGVALFVCDNAWKEYDERERAIDLKDCLSSLAFNGFTHTQNQAKALLGIYDSEKYKCVYRVIVERKIMGELLEAWDDFGNVNPVVFDSYDDYRGRYS